MTDWITERAERLTLFIIRPKRLVEEATVPLQRTTVDGVIHTHSFPPDGDQTRLPQNLQVVRDQVLREVEIFLNFTDAALAILQKEEDAQALRSGNDAEEALNVTECSWELHCGRVAEERLRR